METIYLINPFGKVIGVLDTSQLTIAQFEQLLLLGYTIK